MTLSPAAAAARSAWVNIECNGHREWEAVADAVRAVIEQPIRDWTALPDLKVPSWSEDFLWHRGRAYARDEVLRLLDGGES